jgi:ribosomal RNA-processing protein 12
VAPPALLSKSFKGLLTELLQTSALTGNAAADQGELLLKQRRTHAMMGLVLAVAAHLGKGGDLSTVELLFRTVQPHVRDDSDPVLQKKAYSTLLLLCKRHPDFVFGGPVKGSGKLTEMLGLLRGESLLTCQAGAKRLRLRCLCKIFEQIDVANGEHVALVPECIGEVMLCTKEANFKARSAAFELLGVLGQKMADAPSTHFGGVDAPEGGAGCLPELFQMVLGGLAAVTPHMRSASVLSLARLMFQFGQPDETRLRESRPEQGGLGRRNAARQEAMSQHVMTMVPQLLETVLLLLREKAREVVKSVIGFVKVVVGIAPTEVLEPLLPLLVSSETGLLLNNWAHDPKNRFKAKIKTILSRLCRRFGYDAVSALMPEKDRRLVVHLQKVKRREAAKKAKDREMEKADAEPVVLPGGARARARARELEKRRLRQTNRGFDQMVGSDDDEDEDGDGDDADYASVKGRAAGGAAAGGKKAARAALKERRLASQGRVSEAGGKVLDLLDRSSALAAVEMIDQGAKQGKAKGKRGHDDADMGDVEYDKESGRLMVPEDDEADAWAVHERQQKRQADHNAEVAAAGGGKRRRREEPAGKKPKPGGDVMKKGQKFEPFQWMPLDPKMMSGKKFGAGSDKAKQFGTVGTKKNKRRYQEK